MHVGKLPVFQSFIDIRSTIFVKLGKVQVASGIIKFQRKVVGGLVPNKINSNL